MVYYSSEAVLFVYYLIDTIKNYVCSGDLVGENASSILFDYYYSWCVIRCLQVQIACHIIGHISLFGPIGQYVCLTQ
jgi:hypothetical protein